MSARKKPKISPRKQPKQARSTALVDVILEAAVQVLAQQGAHRFTTARVAEKAGVSVGSLYQYFPNKAAILFQLQRDEWQETTELLRRILEDVRRPPLDRLRALVHAFVRSECDEAKMRVALDDAAPLYRDAPEAQEAMAAGDRIIHVFMREALPDASDAGRALAADLITSTLIAAARQFSESPRTSGEIKAYCEAMADMFCAYLEPLRSVPVPAKCVPRAAGSGKLAARLNRRVLGIGTVQRKLVKI